VCPWNGGASAGSAAATEETDARSHARTRGQGRAAVALQPVRPRELSLVQLMRMTRDEWDVYTRGSAIRRAGYAGLKRNVAVAMGNWFAALDAPPEDAVAALTDALQDEEPLVREHAAWALEQSRSPR
jgi:epoxyqueuosine reductase QueG